MKPKLGSLRQVDKGKYFCVYCGRMFETDKTPPIDCPQYHLTKDALRIIFEDDYEMRIDFLIKYPKGLRSLTDEQLEDIAVSLSKLE